MRELSEAEERERRDLEDFHRSGDAGMVAEIIKNGI